MVPRPPLAKGAPATAAQTSQEVVCLDWHNVLQHRNELFLRDEERAALRKALSCHKFRIWVISFVGRDRRRKTDELMSRCLAPVRAAFPNLLGWFTITKKVGEGGKVHQALEKGCSIIIDDSEGNFVAFGADFLSFGAPKSKERVCPLFHISDSYLKGAMQCTKVYENRLAEGVVHQATPGYRKCTHMVRQRRSSRSQLEKRLHIVLKHGGTLQKHWIEAAMMELLNLSTSAQPQVLAWFRYAGPRPLNFPKI